MDLLKLQYFMAVMEQLNFTKAAKKTYTSQSNISKQISQLEEELEVKLFYRRNIGVEPTPSAEYLYENLAKILPDIDRLFAKVKEIQDSGSHDIIRLGLCESMDLERIVPHFFSRLFETDSEMEIRIETHISQILLEKLATDELDCIFLFSVLSADMPSLKRIPLTRYNPMLYYAKSHRLYQKTDLKLTDFSNETFVRSTTKNQWYDQYKVLPFEPKRIIEANSLNAAFLYVESGAAVAVLGQSQNYLGKDTIATLEIPTQDQKVGSDALWSVNNKNPALPKFVIFLSQFVVR